MTTRHYEQPLTDERLFAWHASLFPSGRSGMTKIRAGAWRDDSTGPMEVVSGPVGKDRVHYQAPPAKRLAREMPTLIRSRKLGWPISGSSPYTRSMTVTVVLRARLQTWLSRAQKTVPQRFYSMSAQIRQERGAYYDILEETQKGTIDIPPWMEWFPGCLGRAIDGAQTTLI